MKTYTKDELTEILRLHKMWLNDEDGGRRADLRGADLQGVVLRGANIDFSCIMLACKHTEIKMDIEQIRQIAYTLYMQECDDPEYEQIKRKLWPHVSKWNGLKRHRLHPVPPKTLRKRDAKGRFVKKGKK